MEDKSANQTPARTEAVKKRSGRLSRFGRGLNRYVWLLLIIAIGLAVFFGWKWHQSQNQQKHPDLVAKAQTQDLVNKVGKLTVLPTGETPTVATVSDVSKLAGQTFFANAKNGDKVLIYGNAKKAYLYRPSTDQIINIAPLNVNTGSQ